MYVGAGTGISLVYQANLFLQLSISGSEQSEPSTWPVFSGPSQYLTSRHCFSTVGWTSKIAQCQEKPISAISNQSVIIPVKGRNSNRNDLPSLKKPGSEVTTNEALTAVRLRVMRPGSLASSSASDAFSAVFNDTVGNTESANCLGTKDPVFERVTTRRPSDIATNTSCCHAHTLVVIYAYVCIYQLSSHT